MLKVNPYSCKCPPGRKWKYEEDEFSFEDESPEVVAGKVGKYRLEHGKTIGEPLQDVLEHTKKKYPYLVIRVESSNGISEETSNCLSDKICDFLLAQKEPIKSCEIELIASIRRDICEQCKYCKKVSFDTKEEDVRYDRLLARYTYGKCFKHIDLGCCSRYMRDCREMIYQATENLPINDYSLCWIGKDLSEFID